MVAIRHTASNEQQRTTMILLCEDGSLRIYMANVDNTSFWLQPSLQPSSGISILKPVRKRKAAATSKIKYTVNKIHFILGESSEKAVSYLSPKTKISPEEAHPAFSHKASPLLSAVNLPHDQVRPVDKLCLLATIWTPKS